MIELSHANRSELERRLDALTRQVREYPTPIARCDVQLGALLEERSQVVAELQRLDATPSALEICKWEGDGGNRAD